VSEKIPRDSNGLFVEEPVAKDCPSHTNNDCPGLHAGKCPAMNLNRRYTDGTCGILVEGRLFPLMYEEMVEFLATLRGSRERGAEHFEDARAKAVHLLAHHVTPTAY